MAKRSSTKRYMKSAVSKTDATLIVSGKRSTSIRDCSQCPGGARFSRVSSETWIFNAT